MSGNEPQRSCIYCRTVKNKGELLRFVLSPDRILVPDLQEKLPGRGAYTCMKISCLRGAAEKKQFSRAFKGEVREADAAGLISRVAVRIEERIASYLSLANKAGKVVSGTDMVLDAMKHRSLGIVFIASDISVDIGAKVKAQTLRVGVESISIFDKDRLGALIGKGLRSVVAVEGSGFIRSLRQEMEKYRNFFEGGRE
jgi:predicted RNA-binding protein YlxR (DUF448 family)/ribosomal protein L30E